ncbi:MAG: DUF4382 domain-containing protein [Cyanobacteria bacterium RI_101]|nr:DUF4382 domain-containing protein [Cyanobacteria bacterium RI_101]
MELKTFNQRHLTGGKKAFYQTALIVCASFLFSGCGQERATQPDNSPAPSSAAQDAGTLAIYANGEDFVRQGFISKDGWKIRFDQVEVTLDQVTAYQSDPPFDPRTEPPADPQAQIKVSLQETKTLDLAQGDEAAEPILVASVAAPAGRYNALSWRLAKSGGKPPLMLKGVAVKDGQEIPFTLTLDQELAFVCGDFVGDKRKGLVEAGQEGELEATFHFDHLFGDADAPADDELNTGALGFAPLAALAQDGQVNLDLAALKAKLSQEDYAKLLKILPSLGHVGEGHCRETLLTS